MSFGFAKMLVVIGVSIVEWSMLAPSAHAYIPPASFILTEALKTHADIKTIVMEGKITDLKTQTTLTETLHIDFPAGRLSAVYMNDKELDGTYESSVKEIHRLGKFWINLAMDPNGTRFREALQELNVASNDKTDVKLSRIGHNVIWTWGKDPMIAFFKDEFLPVEYQTGSSEGNNQEDFLVTEYTSATSDTRVPKSITIKLQGREAYRYEVKSVKLNQTLKFPATTSGLKSATAKDWVTLVR